MVSRKGIRTAEMKRIAVIAALPGELKPLVRGWKRESRNGVDLWKTRQSDCEWVAACAGIGASAAARAFVEIESEGPLNAVVSLGWAGSLSGEFEVGRAYSVSEVIDIHTGEHFGASERAVRSK